MKEKKKDYRNIALMLSLLCAILLAIAGVSLYYYNIERQNLETWKDYAQSLADVAGLDVGLGDSPRVRRVREQFERFLHKQR